MARGWQRVEDEVLGRREIIYTMGALRKNDIFVCAFQLNTLHDPLVPSILYVYFTAYPGNPTAI